MKPLKQALKWLHGSGFFNFNDAILNARNAFAPERAPTRTRRYGFLLALSGQAVRFLVDSEKREINESATVRYHSAIRIFDLRQCRLPWRLPNDLFIGLARADWQWNAANTFIARYDFNFTRLGNQGVGALISPDRSFASEYRRT